MGLQTKLATCEVSRRMKLPAAGATLKILSNDGWGVLQDYTYEYPIDIKVTPAGQTLDYKAVFAIWSRAMAEQFTARDPKERLYTEKEMRKLMYHRFLGYEDTTIGKTKIENQLRNIKDLDRGECYNLLRKVEEWCQTVGVTLPESPNTQYQQDKDRQNE